MNAESIVGCILGTAVADAIGLPYEGLSPGRAAKLLGPPNRHRFLLGRGMVSDDTEHTCLVGQALLAARGDVRAFQRSLAWGLRRWLLGVPAGMGLATLRATLRLWAGFGPDRSGVFSAGNGPAMRAAILGVTLGDSTQLREFVRVSTRITHTDPKAESGALAVALAAHLAAQLAVEGGTVEADEYLSCLRATLDNSGHELLTLIEGVVQSVKRGEGTGAFARSMGLAKGVSGYIYHCVPVALHAWLSHPRNYRAAIESVVSCGGDADTTAAVTGGIVGAAVGRSGIPRDWLSGLLEWPRTARWMEQLGTQLATIGDDFASRRPPRLPALGILARNLVFLLVVLSHGFRRLAPPY